jgi:hypothetical protein
MSFNPADNDVLEKHVGKTMLSAQVIPGLKRTCTFHSDERADEAFASHMSGM